MTNVKQFLCHNHFTLILDRNNRLYFTGEIKRIGSVYGGSQPTQILTDVIKIGKYYAGFYAILNNGSCLATVPEFNYIVRNKGVWFKFIEPTAQSVGGKWGNLIQQVFLKVNGIDYSSAIMDMKQKRDFNYLILTTDGHVFHISGVYKKMNVVTHGTDNILIDYCYDNDQVIRADANRVLHIETNTTNKQFAFENRIVELRTTTHNHLVGSTIYILLANGDLFVYGYVPDFICQPAHTVTVPTLIRSQILTFDVNQDDLFYVKFRN